MRKYKAVRKIAIGKENHYGIGCLLGYNYFKERYKVISIYSSIYNKH